MAKKNQAISDRDHYTKLLTDQAEHVEQFKKIYKQLTETKVNLLSTLEREKKEHNERESDLKALIDQRSKMESLKKDAEKKLAELQDKLKKEQEIHDQKARMRQAMQEREIPELNFFKRVLALDIEALRKDLMKFIFTNIDCDDWSREFIIIIDVSSSNYRVTACEPKIDSLDSLVQELNSVRDFYLFLKRVRQNFTVYVKEEQKVRSQTLQ